MRTSLQGTTVSLSQKYSMLSLCSSTILAHTWHQCNITRSKSYWLFAGSHFIHTLTSTEAELWQMCLYSGLWTWVSHLPHRHPLLGHLSADRFSISLSLNPSDSSPSPLSQFNSAWLKLIAISQNSDALKSVYLSNETNEKQTLPKMKSQQCPATGQQINSNDTQQS